MIQQELFDADEPTPPAQRHSATSQDAAQRIEPRAETLRRIVLEAIRASADGLTDEEGIALTDMPANTYRPRRVELWRMNWIRDSGRTRATRSGRAAVVWEVITNG